MLCRHLWVHALRSVRSRFSITILVVRTVRVFWSKHHRLSVEIHSSHNLLLLIIRNKNHRLEFKLKLRLVVLKGCHIKWHSFLSDRRPRHSG